MADFIVYCPACEAAFQVPEDRAGEALRMRCGRCGLLFELNDSNSINIQQNILSRLPTESSRNQPEIVDQERREQLARLGPPPPYRPIAAPPLTRHHEENARPDQKETIGDAPTPVDLGKVNRLVPPPPYRPISAVTGTPIFPRGQAPDLEPWRRASLSRDAVYEPDDEETVPFSKGPGLVITPTNPPRRRARSQASWSIRREQTPEPEPENFSLPPARTEPPPHEDGIEFPVFLTSPGEADLPGDRIVSSFRRTLPWAAIPAAAGVIGGGLYVMRGEVMRAFPQTIPIYHAFGLNHPAAIACDDEGADVAPFRPSGPCQNGNTASPNH